MKTPESGSFKNKNRNRPAGTGDHSPWFRPDFFCPLYVKSYL